MNTTSKKGYKFTEEFGYIPNDWEVEKIRDIAQIYGRIGFRGYTKNDIVAKGYGAISLSPTNIKENGLFYDDNTYISWYKYEESPEIKINNGDILLVKTGSSYGKSSIVEHLPQEATINPQLIVFKNLKINNKFFAHILKTKEFIKQIEKVVVGGAIPTLSQEQIYNFNTIYPPLHEQHRIAEVLSDVDSLIDKTLGLINKKKDLKTATMQKLLAPKPNWETKALGEITPNIYQPQTISQNMLTESGYPVFGANGIIGYYSKFNHEKPQIAITCRGNTCGTVNLTLPFSWITGNAMVVNIDNVEFNKFFLFCLLQYKDLSNLITGSGQPQIIRSSLTEFKISYPNISEQNKIAEILLDMDDEIMSLEKEAVKFKSIKTALMQELLSGKIRLKG